MKVIKKLSRDLFNSETSCVSLGKLSPEMINFIISKVPQMQDILSVDRDILFWKDRIDHTLRHKDDFISDNEYEHCFEDIPYIINNPDYISYNKKHNSLSFIKAYSDNINVAVRISSSGQLSYRTMYPIVSASLDNFINKNTAWKYTPQASVKFYSDN